MNDGEQQVDALRILVGWDEASEADLISMYLGLEENVVAITTDPEELVTLARDRQGWDIVLMATSLPDSDTAFSVFQQVCRELPDAPVVGACHTQDVFRIARFLTNGMRSYVLRDSAGDYVFLLQVTLQAAVEAVRAEREQKVAERLREEVDSVRRLQESIIPVDLVSPPGYQVCARYEPSQIRSFGRQPVVMAGGDYYDAFVLDQDNVVVLVGDASGHGMKACMSIMTMHTLIRMIRSNQYRDTASFVAEVNRHLCDQTVVGGNEGGFITLMYGILHTQTHEFQWTSAGHPMPLLHDLRSNEVTAIASNDAGALPLGIYDDAEYESNVTIIPPHSRLMLYTDGLAEAFRDDDDRQLEFGIEGIIRTLIESRERQLDEALENLFEASHDFTLDAGRHDDTSVVLVERE